MLRATCGHGGVEFVQRRMRGGALHLRSLGRGFSAGASVLLRNSRRASQCWTASSSSPFASFSSSSSSYSSSPTAFLSLSASPYSSSSRGGGDVWSATRTRRAFIDYFETHGHCFVPSSSIIPPKGSGTYFVNAGMNQFKSLFLGDADGFEVADLKRAVNSQKCIRVGGKHNDLDEVGADTYHHTFFEMLGSWSFGDYFKAEACAMAWNILTKVYRLPADRLYVTYFDGDDKLGIGPDVETRDVWAAIGVPRSRILPFGTGANFWEMAETGPCGPCTEIHYDYVGCRDASAFVNASSPEVVELWNLVFIQFNRVGPRELRPLPRRHVDTGMGLERLCTVLQNARSNYDTDLFRPILKELSENCPVPPYSGLVGSADVDGRDAAFRTVADHARMYTVAIADGLLPCAQSEDSGHKLRQVMHRAFRALRRKLHAPPGVAGLLVEPVVQTLGEAYPELLTKAGLVKEIVSQEESDYLALLSTGFEVLHRMRQQKGGIVDSLSAEDVKDIAAGRYGEALSPDLIYDIAEECSIQIKQFIAGGNSSSTSDGCGSSAAHQKQSVTETPTPATITAAATAERATVREPLPPSLGSDLRQIKCPTTNDSDKYLYSRDASGSYDFRSMVGGGRIVALWSPDSKSLVTRLDQPPGSVACVVLDRTGFYAEAGGQVSDKGSLISEGFEAEVVDVQHVSSYVVHRCVLKRGTLSVGDSVTGRIDEANRLRSMRNHSATHLLNFALRKVLGPDVRQCGSHVGPDHLSLAVSCTADLSLAQIKEVEQIVRASIAAGAAADVSERPLAAVRALGDRIALLQEETYPSQVRVVAFGTSVDNLMHATGSLPNCLTAELCCGTHVLNTADIRDFAIVNASGAAQGTKRLTAVTGELATEARQRANTLRESATKLAVDVAGGAEAASWEQRLRDIYRGCSEELLPKVAREEITDFLTTSRLQEKIHSADNARALIAFEEEVDGLLHKQADEAVAVVACNFEEVKEASKFLRKRMAKKPTALYTRQANGTITVVCYAPAQLARPNFLVEWASTVTATLGGGRCVPAKGKNMHQVYVVQAAGSLSPTGGEQQESGGWQDRVNSVVRQSALQLLDKHRQ